MLNFLQMILAGPAAGGLVVGASALFVGWSVTHRVGQFNFLFQFTQRFHQIAKEMHALNRTFKLQQSETPAILQDDAQALYGQLFALVMDEYLALRHGLLRRDVMTEWMMWRAYAFGDKSGRIANSVAGRSYPEAWLKWSGQRALEGHKIVSFLNEIHSCHDRGGGKPAQVRGHVEAVVRKYAGRWRF